MEKRYHKLLLSVDKFLTTEVKIDNILPCPTTIQRKICNKQYGNLQVYREVSAVSKYSSSKLGVGATCGDQI